MDSLQNLLRFARGRLGLGWILAVVFIGIVSVSFPPLALFSYDASFVVSRPPASITNVVLVYFNQETISELGGWHGELNRTNHARLLDYLAKDGARLVIYDVLFAETNVVPAEDQILARAIKNNGAVILAAGEVQSKQSDDVVESLWRPATPFREAAEGWGHVVLKEDVIRKISGDFLGQTNLPYLPWVGAVLLKTGQFNEASRDLIRWLNYYSPPGGGAIPDFYFHDVLNGTVPPGTFRGKVVFVGQNVSFGDMDQSSDKFLTPYSRFGFSPMPGVEIHATAFLNLIRGESLFLVPIYWQWAAAGFWGVLCLAVFQPLIARPKTIQVLTTLLLAASLFAISLYVQWRFHWWWAWIGPAVGQPVAALASVWTRRRPDRFAAFISYRKSEDTEFALLIRDKLSSHGKGVCIDQKSLNAGQFDEQLLHLIEVSQFFIVLLSPKSLERCVNEDDWIRRELGHAILHKKTIIPVFKNGFNFTGKEHIPDVPEIAALQRYHGLEYSSNDVDGFITQLIMLLNKKGS